LGHQRDAEVLRLLHEGCVRGAQHYPRHLIDDCLEQIGEDLGGNGVAHGARSSTSAPDCTICARQPGGMSVVVSIWLTIAGPGSVRPSASAARPTTRASNCWPNKRIGRVVSTCTAAWSGAAAMWAFGIAPVMWARSSFIHTSACSLAWP